MTRTFLLTLLVAATVSPGAANAEVEIEENTEYYNIEGKTVRQLSEQMRRKGPPHDDGDHAIAVTKTRIRPGYSVRETADGCSIASINTVIEVTIVYPEWVNQHEAPRKVQYAWDAFMREVVDHEDQHSAYASDAAYALDNDLGFLEGVMPCDDLKRRAQRIIKGHFDELERRNREFHKDEERKWSDRARKRRRR